MRDFATDKHRSVDDRPYGGGTGMVIRVDIVDRALQSIRRVFKKQKTRVILLDPRAGIFTQKKAYSTLRFDHIILICGHYEGVDWRVTTLVDESISIGRYILTGGEIPALVVTDCIVRLLPNVLSKPDATVYESFSGHYLYEPPQYTRPKVYKKMRVPRVLLSGDPKKIAAWKAGFRGEKSS